MFCNRFRFIKLNRLVLYHSYFDDLRAEDPEFSNQNSKLNNANVTSNSNNHTFNNQNNPQGKTNNNIAFQKQISKQSKIEANSNINNLKNMNSLKEEDINNNNMNMTHKGKFGSTKSNNFGITNHNQDSHINQQNYSKSPPKENFINVNVNNNHSKYNNLPTQQIKQNNKKFTNFENNSTSFNYMINHKQGGYQTFYNMASSNNDYKYNFDIETNFEERLAMNDKAGKLAAAIMKKNQNGKLNKIFYLFLRYY